MRRVQYVALIFAIYLCLLRCVFTCVNDNQPAAPVARVSDSENVLPTAAASAVSAARPLSSLSVFEVRRSHQSLRLNCFDACLIYIYCLC